MPLALIRRWMDVHQGHRLWDAVKAWQSHPAASAGDSVQVSNIHPTVI